MDYYKITTTTAAPKLRLTLTNLPANYNLYLYASKTNGTLGSLISSSTNTGTTSETIIYNTPTTGRLYYIRVIGSGGAFSNMQCYTLTANTSSTNFIRPFESTVEPQGENLDNETLSVFPNPASDEVNVRFNALEEADYTLQILDITGKEMLRKIANFKEGENFVGLQTNTLAKGIYFIKVGNENQEAITTKLVIER